MFDIKLHRQILFELITDIYRSPSANFLGFKGGTMAYFFYGLDRFSTDLDFDLIEKDKINEVKKILPQIVLKYGQIKEQKDKRYTIFYLLSYKKGSQNIKIEISKRINFPYSYYFENFYGTEVKILSEVDSFATKLLACTTRNRLANRDFYDVYFYLKKGVYPNEKIIKKIAGCDLIAYLEYLIKFIEKNLNNKTILHGIGELVDENQKIWIKKNLKKELLNRLKYLIGEDK